MKEAYIGIPSLTEAQHASELLRQERIGNAVIRMPALPGKRGCAFGLRLWEIDLDNALAHLKKHGFRIGRILVRDGRGMLQERKA